eukprot:6185350-Pleurochrysis_carterae.AAC.5
MQDRNRAWSFDRSFGLGSMRSQGALQSQDRWTDVVAGVEGMVRVRRLANAARPPDLRRPRNVVHDSSVRQRRRGGGCDARTRRVRQIAVVTD